MCGFLLVHCGAAEETAELPRGASPVPPVRSIRVVSLAPAASHLLLALGAGALIVGVDTASSRIPALGSLPVSDLASAPELAPDLILVPALAGEDASLAGELRARGQEVLEFAPTDITEAFVLCRDLGARLVGPLAASAFQNRLGRELALIGGSSFGRPRPRVAALASLTPPELASGHSFTTDLIQLAGGTSITHEDEDTPLATDRDQLSALAPDLLLVVSPGVVTENERLAALELLPASTPVAFFVFDAEQLWMREVVAAAREAGFPLIVGGPAPRASVLRPWLLEPGAVRRAGSEDWHDASTSVSWANCQTS